MYYVCTHVLPRMKHRDRVEREEDEDKSSDKDITCQSLCAQVRMLSGGHLAQCAATYEVGHEQIGHGSCAQQLRSIPNQIL